MKEVYKRRLTLTEAERCYIYIERDYQDTFSGTHRIVRIRFDKQEFNAKIDKLGRIFLSKFRDYIILKEGYNVVFYENPDGSFNLSVKE